MTVATGSTLAGSSISLSRIQESLFDSFASVFAALALASLARVCAFRL